MAFTLRERIFLTDEPFVVYLINPIFYDFAFTELNETDAEQLVRKYHELI